MNWQLHLSSAQHFHVQCFECCPREPGGFLFDEEDMLHEWHLKQLCLMQLLILMCSWPPGSIPSCAATRTTESLWSREPAIVVEGWCQLHPPVIGPGTIRISSAIMPCSATAGTAKLRDIWTPCITCNVTGFQQAAG